MCHNVFHVRLLEPFEDITIFGRVQSPPPPKELEGQEEHEVEAILDSKFFDSMSSIHNLLHKIDISLLITSTLSLGRICPQWLRSRQRVR